MKFEQEFPLGLGKNDTIVEWPYFRITPLYFSSKVLMEGFSIGYMAMENSSAGSIVDRVGLELGSRNNSYGYGPQYDGDVTTVYGKLGDKKGIIVRPEKYLYIKDSNCREKPYYEIWQRKASDIMNRTCARPCRNPFLWAIKDKNGNQL